MPSEPNKHAEMEWSAGLAFPDGAIKTARRRVAGGVGREGCLGKEGDTDIDGVVQDYCSSARPLRCREKRCRCVTCARASVDSIRARGQWWPVIDLCLKWTGLVLVAVGAGFGSHGSVCLLALSPQVSPSPWPSLVVQIGTRWTTIASLRCLGLLGGNTEASGGVWRTSESDPCGCWHFDRKDGWYRRGATLIARLNKVPNEQSECGSV